MSCSELALQDGGSSVMPSLPKLNGTQEAILTASLASAYSDRSCLSLNPAQPHAGVKGMRGSGAGGQQGGHRGQRQFGTCLLQGPLHHT